MVWIVPDVTVVSVIVNIAVCFTESLLVGAFLNQICLLVDKFYQDGWGFRIDGVRKGESSGQGR